MSQQTSDEAKFVAFGHDLVEAARVSVGPWVLARLAERFGGSIPDEFQAGAASAASAATTAVVTGLEGLVSQDIDRQRTTPLSTIRLASGYVAEVLSAAGAPPVNRDPDAVRLYPDDHYDLAIGSFAELSDELQLAGIQWGAGKAHIHLARRRREGQL